MAIIKRVSYLSERLSLGFSSGSPQPEENGQEKEQGEAK